MDQMVNIVIWAAIVQGYLLGILFLSSKEYNSWSNKLLGFFLLSLLFELTATMLPIDNILGYEIWNYFSLPDTKILFSVLFVHYVLQKLSRVPAYRRFLRVNYIIAFAVMFITVVNMMLFIIKGKSIYEYLTFNQVEYIHMAQQTYAFFIGAAMIPLTIREVKRYKEIALNTYSDMDLLSLDWLWRFVLLLIPAVLLWGAELTRIYVGYYTGDFTEWNFVEINYFALTIFIYVISYQAFSRNDLFEGGKEPNQETISSSSPEKGLGHIIDLEEPLNMAMKEDKIFLKKDLTIFDVAKHVGSSTKKVSSCINTCFGSNFSEWVNKYRVEEAKIRIDQSENNYLTIEAIGQDSGFKSRSAMYSAFKKFTGDSPAKLRSTTLS